MPPLVIIEYVYRLETEINPSLAKVPPGHLLPGGTT
jgi:hypothetical protein